MRLKSDQVLNLTVTHTIFEAVQGSRCLLQSVREAMGKRALDTFSLEGSHHASDSQSALIVVQTVQNSTGLALECWIAPSSQAPPEGSHGDWPP